MSIESMAIALNHSRASGTALVVLIGIANHDGDGGAWPSISTLARYANVGERNVQRAIDKLVSLHEVRRHVQAGGDHRVAEHQRPNRYDFLLTCPPDCDRSRRHRTARFKPVELDLDELSTGVALAPPGGAGATPPVALAPPKPSLNPTTTKTPHLTHVPNRVRNAANAPCGHKWITERHCEMGCSQEATA